MKRKINLKKILFFVFLAIAFCSVFTGVKVLAAGNGNGIEVFTPILASPSISGLTTQGNIVELFINAPIHDAPAGTYPKNAVPLQYHITYAVCANSISYVRVIGRFDLNGGKQTTLAGTNANWQIVHDQLYTNDTAYKNGVCANGDHSCFLSSPSPDFSGTLDFSSLPSTVCSTTLQMVAKFNISGWGGSIPDETIDLSNSSFTPTALAHGVNLWVNFSCPPPAPTPATLHIIKVVVNNNSGTAIASDFNLHVKLSGADVAGSPVSGAGAPGTSYTLAPGAYAVSEDANSSYNGSFSGDCDASGNITLASGDNKTCTLTNDDIAPPSPSCVGSCGGPIVPPVIPPVIPPVVPKFPNTGTVPLIHLTKVPDPLTLPVSGGMVTYTYTVTNQSTIPLSNVNIVDDKCEPVNYVFGDLNTDFKLDPSENWIFTCQTKLTQTTTNTAVASGEANGIIVTDSAMATVTVPIPGFPRTGFAPFGENSPYSAVLLFGDIMVVALACVVIFKKQNV